MYFSFPSKCTTLCFTSLTCDVRVRNADVIKPSSQSPSPYTFVSAASEAATAVTAPPPHPTSPLPAPLRLPQRGSLVGSAAALAAQARIVSITTDGLTAIECCHCSQPVSPLRQCSLVRTTRTPTNALLSVGVMCNRTSSSIRTKNRTWSGAAVDARWQPRRVPSRCGACGVCGVVCVVCIVCAGCLCCASCLVYPVCPACPSGVVCQFATACPGTCAYPCAHSVHRIMARRWLPSMRRKGKAGWIVLGSAMRSRDA